MTSMNLIFHTLPCRSSVKLRRVGRLGRRSLQHLAAPRLQGVGAVLPGQECLKRERTLRLSAEAAPSTAISGSLRDHPWQSNLHRKISASNVVSRLELQIHTRYTSPIPEQEGRRSVMQVRRRSTLFSKWFQRTPSTSLFQVSMLLPPAGCRLGKRSK